MDKYICTEVITADISPYPVCKTWAVMPPGALDSLMITKDDAVIIGSSLAGFFAILIAFAIIVKGLKSM